jgi:hypothetical protein
MNSEQLFTLTVSKNDLAIIRNALCDKSIRTLHKAFSVRDEELEKERDDNYLSAMFFEDREKIRSLIDKIDTINI